MATTAVCVAPSADSAAPEAVRTRCVRYCSVPFRGRARVMLLCACALLSVVFIGAGGWSGAFEPARAHVPLPALQYATPVAAAAAAATVTAAVALTTARAAEATTRAANFGPEFAPALTATATATRAGPSSGSDENPAPLRVGTGSGNDADRVPVTTAARDCTSEAHACLNGGTCVSGTAAGTAPNPRSQLVPEATPAGAACVCAPNTAGTRCQYRCDHDRDDPMAELGPVVLTAAGPVRLPLPDPCAASALHPHSVAAAAPPRTWPIPQNVTANTQLKPFWGLNDDTMMAGTPYHHPRSDSIGLRARRWRDHWRHSLLIVHYNHPGWDDSLYDLHIPLYEHVFGHIVAVADARGRQLHTERPDDARRWVWCDIPRSDVFGDAYSKGVYMQYCVAQVLTAHPGYRGYQMINNDVVFHYWRVPYTHWWMSHYITSARDWLIDVTGANHALASCTAQEQTMFRVHEGATHGSPAALKLWHRMADYYYIPGRYAAEWIRITSHLFGQQLLTQTQGNAHAHGPGPGAGSSSARNVLDEAYFMETVSGWAALMSAPSDDIDVMTMIGVAGGDSDDHHLEQSAAQAWYLFNRDATLGNTPEAVRAMKFTKAYTPGRPGPGGGPVFIHPVKMAGCYECIQFVSTQFDAGARLWTDTLALP